MKYKNIDDLMKSALASEKEPGEELNRKIMQRWKEQPDMRKWTKRRITVVATAACLLLMTVTAGAAARYLTAGQVADKAGQAQMAQAFRGDSAIEIGETKEAGDYRFTLLGIASGEALVKSALSEVIDDLSGTYVAVAIERIDGQPMPDTSDDAYGETSFFISPLIQGLKPWQYNAASMNGGYTDTVIDGIHYRLLECDDVVKFADRKLYICASDTAFYDAMAYNYNEATGEISRNESYEGINLLFDFPVDASKADKAAAEEYLRALEESWNAPGEPEDGEDSKSGGDMADVQIIDAMIGDGNIEEALKGAVLAADSTKTVSEKNGRYEYEYGDVTYYFYKENFQDGKDYMVCGSFKEAEEGETTETYIIELTDNGDSTATIQTYIKTIKH